MAMVLGHTAMDLDTAPMDMTLVDTMARGLLMLSLRPRLMPIPTTMVDMDMVLDTTAMDMVLDTVPMDMAIDMAMDMAMATTDKFPQPYLFPNKHQKDNWVIHQEYSKTDQPPNGFYQFEFHLHECCLFQCRQPGSSRNGEQEMLENQNVMIKQLINRKPHLIVL